MTTHFNLWLTGTGWVEVFFASESQNIRFEYSYLSDPLTELLKAVCNLIENKSVSERIVFPEEPGQTCLQLTQISKENIQIEISSSDEWEEISKAYQSPTQEEILYSDNDTLSNFAKVVCDGIDEMLNRQPLNDYKKLWVSFEFPMNSYNKLKQLISAI